MYSLLAFLAITAGLIASTASPLLITMFASTLVALALLANLHWAITLLIVSGLTFNTLFAFFGTGASRLNWAIGLLGFLMVFPALLNLRNLRQSPTFTHAAIAFVIFAILSTALQGQSPLETIGGIKRHFLPFAPLLAVALVPFAGEHFQHWRRVIFAIATIQLPLALYQFLVLVPKRGGLQAGSTVTDVVAGSFGMNMEGGSPNSTMAVFLLIVFAFMVSHWKAGLIQAKWLIVALPFVLIPIGLGEIKVVFVMFPALFFVLYKDELLKRPLTFFGGVVAGGIIFLSMGYILLEWVMHASLEHVVSNTLDYNIGNVGYGGQYLNRGTVLSFWWQQSGWDDPTGFVFGHGIGSSHLDPNALIGGHIAMKWPRHGIGLTTASQLLWDTGIVGLLLYLLIFTLAWRAASELIKIAQNVPSTVADAKALQSTLVLIALLIPYSNDLVTLPSLQILFGTLLGYLSYLYRTQKITLSAFEYTRSTRWKNTLKSHRRLNHES